MRSGSICVVAFDPGGHTGWAALQGDLMIADGVTELYTRGIVQGQLPETAGVRDHHLALWNLLGNLHAANYVIIMESFEYRREQRDNVVLVSKEYIGVAKLFVQERNATLPDEAKIVYVEQTAATGKGFWYPKVPGKKDAWDGSKLKAVGLYNPTTEGRHRNDATAHLLHWLTFGPFNRKEYLQQLKDLD